MTTSAESGSRMVAKRYRLDRVVGRGAMGAVWQAEDTVLHRTVALKEVVLPPGLSREDRAVACERTFREARAIARLAHPNVVTLYDVVEEDQRPWVVMELVPARSLAQVLKEDGPLDSSGAAKIGLAVLGALQAAHEAGITHRDVKPGNILIADDGRVKLTDFGIARAAGDMTLTGTGLLVGSPSYMAPEVIRGEELRPTADLFGLGATLYCAVEGHPPFNGSDAISTLNAVVSEPPKPYKRAGSLRPVLDGLLEKDPRARLSAVHARQMLLETLRESDPNAAQALTPKGLATARTAVARTSAAGAQAAPDMPGLAGARGAGAERAAEATQAMRSDAARGAAAAPPHWGPAAGGQRPPTPPVLLPTGEAPGSRYNDVFAPQRRPSASARTYGKIAAVVGLCLALLLGGFVLSRAVSGGSDKQHQTGAQAAGGKEEPRPGSVPKGYEKYSDPKGRFSVAVPQGWTQEQQRNAMKFQDPSSTVFLRMYDLAGSRPRAAFAEAGFKASHNDYQRLRLEDVSYRDFDAAEWEFTYSANGVTRHVLWRGFVAGGRLYGIYLSAPEDQFEGNMEAFTTAVDTFTLL